MDTRYKRHTSGAELQLCDQVMPGYGAECGGRVTVGSKWRKISSPNYPEEFREGQECSWLFVAPKNQHVQLQFIVSRLLDVIKKTLEH